MRVVEVDPFKDERWERYVTSQPRGLVYHRAAWLRVLAPDYGNRFQCFLAEDDAGEVAGILALMHVRGVPVAPTVRLGGPRVVSLPRTPIAGPLFSSDDAGIALARTAIERVDGQQLHLKPPPGLGSALNAVLKPVPVATSYVLTLPPAGEELRFGASRNHAAIKRAVNKAARQGVEVRVAATEADLRAWYGLYLETMRRHVAPPRPYRFFRRMWELLRPAGMLELLLAEDASGPSPHLLAGCLFLMSGQTVVFAFNGRRERDLPARPNDALHWHAIHRAHRAGFRHYDFGEVDDANQGLAQFKLKWGAAPERLVRFVHPATAAGPAQVPAGNGRGTRALRSTWQRVPLWATARVSGVLHRYV
jgi:hypothetical protein